MKIHVCLISDQTLQNLIPALMERPDIVWMVVSAQMHKRGLDARLKGLLRQMLDDPAVIVKECLDVPDTGMPSIRKRFWGKCKRCCQSCAPTFKKRSN